MSAPVGQSEEWYGSDRQETERWVGKPWRRLAVLTVRTFWKGECVDVMREWSATLGLRRLGWHLHVSLARQAGQDYSEEQNQ